MIVKIEYPKSDSQNHKDRHIQSYLETFISSSSSERLKEFLIYSTGGYYLPNKKIKVVASRRNNFFNSTCSFKIECPQFIGLDKFNICVHGFSCTQNGFARTFVHAKFRVHKAVTVDACLHRLIYNVLIDIVFPMAVFKLRSMFRGQIYVKIIDNT